MIFQKNLLLFFLGIIHQAKGHAFWLNVEDDQVEVTFSEKANVPDTAIQHLKDKIEDRFELAAYSKSLKGGRGKLLKIDWALQEDRITGVLPKGALSAAVMGHLDFGPFNKYGMDVDNLRMQFSSSQLSETKDKLQVSAHAHMKVKPFYVGLDGCDSEIIATVHGLSASIDEKPISVCIYTTGGHEIGCNDVVANDGSDDDDAATARFETDLGTTTTIFAKTRALFPSESGKGVAKIATKAATYKPQCTS